MTPHNMLQNKTFILMQKSTAYKEGFNSNSSARMKVKWPSFCLQVMAFHITQCFALINTWKYFLNHFLQAGMHRGLSMASLRENRNSRRQKLYWKWLCGKFSSVTSLNYPTLWSFSYNYMNIHKIWTKRTLQPSLVHEHNTISNISS